jgi:hypothetical protein
MKIPYSLLGAFGLGCIAVGGLLSARYADRPDVDRAVMAANAAAANKPAVLAEKLCPAVKW